MQKTTSKQSVDSSTQSSSGISALVRIGWMALGPVSMLVLAMGIASVPAWTLGGRDVLFWGGVLLTGILRYVDVTRFEGETANGARATTGDMARYLVGLAVCASVLWFSVQSIEV